MLTQNAVSARILRVWSAPLAVAALCALFQAAGWVEGLRFERALIGAGQWWRLFTGHFVHLGWSHWALNTAGLGLIWALFAPCLAPGRALVCLAFCSLATGVALYAFSPETGWYVGLSGALHGLFAAGLLAQRREQPGLSWLMMAALAGKLVWEQAFGPLPGSESSAGGAVVVDAHAYGAVGGIVFYVLEQGLAEIRKKGKG